MALDGLIRAGFVAREAGRADRPPKLHRIAQAHIPAGELVVLLDARSSVQDGVH